MNSVTVTFEANGEFQLRRVQSRLKDSFSSKGTSYSDVRPTLIIFFGWLYAKQGALEKYFTLYHDKGFDVLFIPGQLKEFCWPSFSFKLAKILLDYLCHKTEKYDFFLVHGMSIGAYNYTSCLITAQENPKIYSNFWKKLRGVIFDSLTIGSTERMKVGVGTGISKNRIIQNIMPSLLAVYFFLTWKNTVVVFEEMVNKFKEQPAKVPTLFFYSRNDPMCDADAVEEMVGMWRRKWTFRVITMCWDKSIHAGHIMVHRQKYLETFEKFLDIFQNNCNTVSKL